MKALGILLLGLVLAGCDSVALHTNLETALCGAPVSLPIDEACTGFNLEAFGD